MLEALDAQTGAQIVFTGANADAMGHEINRRVAAFCRERRGRCVQVSSLGFRRYLSLMSLSLAVVGNSSSGIVEAPSLGVPTVNIGPRQKGRPRARSVIDCNETAEAIGAALDLATSDTMRRVARCRQSPYGMPGAGVRIASLLRRDFLEGILMKPFHDIDWTVE